MITISTILVVAVLCLCNGKSTNRECPSDTVDFATKVNNSSIVVYGKSMAKIMDGTSIFHVFFQVDCILKGPAIPRQINITKAGKSEGKQFCQEFSVGRGYSIAFLEPNLIDPNDDKTYIPADFIEVLDEGNSTKELLARTCSLRRLVPLQSVATVVEVCPAVATDPSCLHADTADSLIELTTISTLVGTDVTNLTTAILHVAVDSGHQTHPINTPQQELAAIQGKSGIVGKVDVDAKSSDSNSITITSVLLVVATAIAFTRF